MTDIYTRILSAFDVPAPAWRDIATAPKDGTWFVAWQDGDVFKCQWRTEDDMEGHLDEGWWDNVNQSFEAPTLWQPLPPSPQIDGGHDDA